MKVLFYSEQDWANSGWRWCEAVNSIDNDIHVEYFAAEPHPFHYYRGNNILLDALHKDFDKAQVANFKQAVDDADIIHYKGDYPPRFDVGDYITASGKLRIITASGFIFRSRPQELLKYVQEMGCKLTVTTPDLQKTDDIDLLPFCFDHTKDMRIARNDEGLIVGHVPSTGRKGTPIIIDAIQYAMDRAPNIIPYVTSKLHATVALEAKRICHVYIDQFADYKIYGNSAVEAMRCGCALLSDCPVKPFSTTAKELPKRILEYAKDTALLHHDQEASYNYFLKHHTYAVIGAKLSEFYKELV